MAAIQIAGPEVRAGAGLRPRRPSAGVVLAVEGTFDLAAAMRAAEEARARTGRVTLDLRHGRVEDVALAAFVREVAGRRITILGLSRHHVRLLRYLEAGTGAEERVP